MTRSLPTSAEPTVTRVPELRLGAAGAGLFVLAAAVHVAGLGVGTATAVYAVAVVASGATVSVRPALLLGATAWALLTGFTVNALAQLTFAPADVARLLVLVGVAAFASTLGAAVGDAVGGARDLSGPGSTASRIRQRDAVFARGGR